MLTSLLAPLLLALPSLADGDKYFGKAHAPTNYTVVSGIFIQDDPSFDADGYDMLSDSFGLIDKSPDRWTKLTELVWLGMMMAALQWLTAATSPSLTRMQTSIRVISSSIWLVTVKDGTMS